MTKSSETRDEIVNRIRKPSGNAAICGRFAMIRRQLGVSQLECSSALGISPGRVISYENHRTPLPCDIALKFCWHYLVSEKWLATCEGPVRPCLDLIVEPIFLKVDSKAPYEEVFSESFSEIAGFIETLSFNELISRLVRNSKILLTGSLSYYDLKRLHMVHDYLFKLLGESIKPAIVAQMIEYTIEESLDYLKKNGIQMDIKKGCLNGGSYLGPMGEI